ncbi:MAG: hypothetical protein KatS3mg076_3274 [Candidatus Binatia bacterium]|nr:MAG: hypothetical protein KatS3mg076_3274 [Candidatus Binatia bacterium]
MTEKRPAQAEPRKARVRRPEESLLTSILLDHAVEIAAECRADAILVYADVLPDGRWEKADRIPQKVLFVTKTEAEQEQQESLGHRVIRVPNVAFTRLGQLKMAIFLALNRGLLDPKDRVVCLSGIDESGTLDTLVVMEVGREFEMLVTPGDQKSIAPNIRPEVLDRVIDIASDLGAEGREGKPVGALFVVGDTERVLPLTRQLVLNPFHGYPEEMRNILDPRLEETIKEFSTIDGAFIVRGDGTIVTAGAYLKTAGLSGESLPQGLGARHHAAAAITGVTDSVAVTVSQSTGTVTIFRNGQIVTEIEKPRRLGGAPRPEATES